MAKVERLPVNISVPPADAESSLRLHAATGIRVSGTKPLIFAVVLGCILVKFPSIGSAQTTCRVSCPDGTSVIADCNVKTDPCPSRTSGNTAVTPPRPSPNLFQLSVARYEAVLARLHAYPHVRVSVNESLPRTPEELSREAGDLFVKTAFWFDRLAYNSERLVPRTKEHETHLKGLYAHERDLKARIITLPAALQQANETLVCELALAEAQERVIASVEAVADRMHARADRAATESVQWLTVASPPDVLLVSAETVAARKTAERQPFEHADRAYRRASGHCSRNSKFGVSARTPRCSVRYGGG